VSRDAMRGWSLGGLLDEEDLARERAKGRELRDSAWWKRRRSDGICHYCSRHFPPKSLTMDHLIPLTRGGRSEKSNLVPCCKECNKAKGNLLPTEWEEYLARIRQENPEGGSASG